VTVADKYIYGNIVLNRNNFENQLPHFIKLHSQPIRRQIVTIEILDKDDNIIDTLQGIATGGSLSIANNNLIRRTGSLSFVLFEELLPIKESVLWMTNKIRVYIGIEDMTAANYTPTHFCIGTFYITEPNVTIGSDDRSITITLEDRMTLWDQTEIEDKMQIPPNVPISDAMMQVLTLFGETKFKYIQPTTDFLVPYTLEFEAGTKVIDIITKIRDLYMDWEAFYDTEGLFVFRQMNLQTNHDELVCWTFDGETDHQLEFQEQYTYKNVKNRVVVIGAMDEKTGLTPKAEARLSDPDSPFIESKIGRRTAVIVESSYALQAQCESRARFELWKASNFQETVNITSIPIFFLDANDVVEVRNPATKQLERYIVDTINIGLGVGDDMQISCHKQYFADDGTIIDSTYDITVNQIIDNIKTKGWLSIPEQRIKDYYGMVGSGNPLIIQFINSEVGGVTAYTTGYTTTKTQTLTIDVADFTPLDGDSGDTHRSKADFGDRILGHEMVHAVMNDVLGVINTMQYPDWFKEGCAEFLHGADERLKTVICNNTSIDDTKLNDLINRAVDLMNGAQWANTSQDYSAGYIIMKYLDKHSLDGKDMKTFFNAIKESTSAGFDAVKEAFASNTGKATFEDFINDFKDNAFNYVKNQVTLNIGMDEEDTGSVAGSDHRGTVPLNAENVFDENQATGVISLGFTVTFQK